MSVAKRPEREKPVKIEQRKVRGVKQTALLAGPIYIGQAQGKKKKKHKKRGAKGLSPSLSASPM